MEQSWRQAKSIFGAMLSAPLFWLVVFFIVPMGIVWLYSFGENRGLIDVAFTGTWSNYAKAFDPLYLNIFWKSIWVAALTTFLCLVMGFPVALAITFAPEKAKAWLLLLIMLPFWTNLLVRTYSLIAVLRSQGYVNSILHWGWNGVSGAMTHAGMHPLPDFQPLDLLYNNNAVIVGLVFVNLPFMVLPLYANLEKHDPALLDAAQDLGASAWQRFWRITFPLSLPGVYAGAALVFIPALGIFAIPDLLGGPNDTLIGNLIKQQFLETRDWPFGSVLSIVLTVAALALAGAAAWFGRRATQAKALADA
jgi:spermidine/putrescine transport system permease protein